MNEVNRIIWILIFFIGSIYMAVLEWGDEQHHALGWFLFMSLWSAICGIGFSIGHWLIEFRKK